MYDELIAELRQHHCDAKEDDTQEVCEECCYDVIIVDKSAPSGFASVCACGLMNRAADAIEDLIAALTASNEVIAKSKPRWIPVTERLPLYGQDVLAVRTYGDGEKCQEVLMAHIAVWDEGTGEKWWNATNITNWMPLPSPPAEE